MSQPASPPPGAPGDAAPPRRRTRLSAERRRALILDAATVVFTEHGYQRGKVSDIARRVGVSEPVVFQNFGTKAALFAAVLEQAAATLADRLREAVDAGRPVPEVLAEWFAPGHVERLHSRGSLGVLFTDAVAHSAGAEIDRAAQQATRHVADGIAELLRRGQAAGDIRVDLDAEAGAWWLLSLLHGHGFRAAVMPHRTRLEPALTALALESLRPAR